MQFLLQVRGDYFILCEPWLEFIVFVSQLYNLCLFGFDFINLGIDHLIQSLVFVNYLLTFHFKIFELVLIGRFLWQILVKRIIFCVEFLQFYFKLRRLILIVPAIMAEVDSLFTVSGLRATGVLLLVQESALCVGNVVIPPFYLVIQFLNHQVQLLIFL